MVSVYIDTKSQFMASSLTIFVLPVGSKTAHAVVFPNLQPRVQKAKANKTLRANVSKIRFLEGGNLKQE